ncbi:MAG: hypothetical protein M1608_11325 [Candidatus Omnitrophica bacterium]|nr:hypothetical protein [Candidatus Omnitrophota bacterium]
MKSAGFSLPVLCGLLLLGAGCARFNQGFYPIGLYSVPSTNDLARVKASGFNLVTGPADRSYLDAAGAAGLRVLAMPGTSAGPHFNAGVARREVSALDSHPALWAWYLVDEPDLNRVAPSAVVRAQRFFKQLNASKPTALVLFKGSEALDYANIADITMIDRYPVPWLPLANFGQHVRMVRLALGPKKPLVAVIQSFDWSYYPELVPGEKNLRAPTFQELRCMTYCALANRATGIFYYAFDAGRWKILDHPASWEALSEVVREVNARLPLFTAEQRWWPYRHDFGFWDRRFNAALESSIAVALLRVNHGNPLVPPGDYLLAVNTTDELQVYRITLPHPHGGTIPVYGENRSLTVHDSWMEDEFVPYAVHIYGPLPGDDPGEELVHSRN